MSDDPIREEEIERDAELIRQMVDALMDRAAFDAIQVIATRPTEDNATAIVYHGKGNIFARIAAAEHWVKRVSTSHDDVEWISGEEDD